MTSSPVGDINLQAEQEQSKYYFEMADVERLKQMYDLYEHEANACLANELVLPAHDYVLKCSHTFNVLDTRGAIGITERQAIFGRMRDLSRQVAETYHCPAPTIGISVAAGCERKVGTDHSNRWRLPVLYPARPPIFLRLASRSCRPMTCCRRLRT